MTRPTILNVVENDICVGCGVCASVTDGKIPITLSKLGYFVADLEGQPDDLLAKASRVCPWADESADENQVGRDLFGDLANHDTRIGYSERLYAGRIADEASIVDSSSGGLTTWLVEQLLVAGEVDGVVHVGANAKEGELFSYTISTSVEQCRASRKSAYYATTMADVLSRIRSEPEPERLAVVGVPCFIQALRLLAREDAEIRRRLRFHIAIVCGHLKSSRYAESLAWQQGIHPTDLASVDFRVKDPNGTAKTYMFAATDRTGTASTPSHSRDLVGANWGHAVFQLNACNFCDDIYGETADVTIGDAWLAKYESNWRGTNVVVVRDPRIERILVEGTRSGSICLEELTMEEVVAAQAGNYRHRHEGLAVRLADDLEAGRWVPRKRISPDSSRQTRGRLTLIRRRRQLSAVSHDIFQIALKKNDLTIYTRLIAQDIAGIARYYRPSYRTRLRRKIKRIGLGMVSRK